LQWPIVLKRITTGTTDYVVTAQHQLLERLDWAYLHPQRGTDGHVARIVVQHSPSFARREVCDSVADASHADDAELFWHAVAKFVLESVDQALRKKLATDFQF